MTISESSPIAEAHAESIPSLATDAAATEGHASTGSDTLTNIESAVTAPATEEATNEAAAAQSSAPATAVEAISSDSIDLSPPETSTVPVTAEPGTTGVEAKIEDTTSASVETPATTSSGFLQGETTTA